jgi:hypothetical protein
VARPPSTHVEPVRPAGPRRGGLLPTIAVLGALSGVAGAAALGRQGPGQVRVATVERSAAMVAPAPTEAPSLLPILALRAEQPRVVLPRILMPRHESGQSPDGATGTSRLRVLSWQADPYES